MRECEAWINSSTPDKRHDSRPRVTLHDVDGVDSFDGVTSGVVGGPVGGSVGVALVVVELFDAEGDHAIAAVLGVGDGDGGLAWVLGAVGPVGVAGLGGGHNAARAWLRLRFPSPPAARTSRSMSPSRHRILGDRPHNTLSTEVPAQSDQLATCGNMTNICSTVAEALHYSQDLATGPCRIHQANDAKVPGGILLTMTAVIPVLIQGVRYLLWFLLLVVTLVLLVRALAYLMKTLAYAVSLYRR